MKFEMKVVLLAIVLVAILVQGVVAEEPYLFVTKWGSGGIDDGQFTFPYGVAVDSAGAVYVADSENNRIQKFYSNGTFILKWGVKGTGDGQFIWPRGVAVDSAGNVYVADTLNNRIQKFYSNGTFIEKWGGPVGGSGDGQFDRPYGVAVDSAGAVVYVADTYNDRIQKFYSNGTFIQKWGSFGLGDGQFGRPQGVAVDSAGDVYVADTYNGRIQKFYSNGTFIQKWGSIGSEDGQFINPYGVAVDSAGNVYVADTWNNRIQKFANHFPVADAGGDQAAIVKTKITLDGSNSSDPNSDIISYEWSFSDGGSATGQIVGKSFSMPDDYTVTLTVTDSDGLSDSDTITVFVIPNLETPVEATQQLIGDVEALGLPKGTETKITAKLDDVLRCLDRANTDLNVVSAELEELGYNDLAENVQLIIDAISSGEFTGGNEPPTCFFGMNTLLLVGLLYNILNAMFRSSPRKIGG
jgi:sugar lactone lactonase YvrE